MAYSRLPPPGTDGSARLPNTTPTFTDDGSLPQIDAVAGIGAEVVNKELTTDYNKGPLNPVAMLPPRLVKKILNLGEFMLKLLKYRSTTRSVARQGR